MEKCKSDWSCAFYRRPFQRQIAHQSAPPCTGIKTSILALWQGYIVLPENGVSRTSTAARIGGPYNPSCLLTHTHTHIILQDVGLYLFWAIYYRVCEYFQRTEWKKYVCFVFPSDVGWSVSLRYSKFILDSVAWLTPLCGVYALCHVGSGVCVCCCIKIPCCCLSRGLISSYFCRSQSMVPASALLWWRSQNWWCHGGRHMQRKDCIRKWEARTLTLYQPALVRTYPVWEPALVPSENNVPMTYPSSPNPCLLKCPTFSPLHWESSL